MTLEVHQNKILELLMELELLMASIYQQMARRYPDHAERYQALASEELEHAGWVEQLQSACLAGQARFAEGRTRTYTISNMIGFLQEFIQKQEYGHLTELQALAAVADFENSLIERQVFQRFTGDTPEVEKTLGRLEATQKQHTGRITTLLQHLRAAARGLS